jgi:hypothetical protein
MEDRTDEPFEGLESVLSSDLVETKESLLYVSCSLGLSPHFVPEFAIVWRLTRCFLAPKGEGIATFEPHDTRRTAYT